MSSTYTGLRLFPGELSRTQLTIVSNAPGICALAEDLG